MRRWFVGRALVAQVVIDRKETLLFYVRFVLCEIPLANIIQLEAFVTCLVLAIASALEQATTNHSTKGDQLLTNISLLGSIFS